MLNRPNETSTRRYTLACPYGSPEDSFLEAIRTDSAVLWTEETLSTLDDVRVHLRGEVSSKVAVITDSPRRRLAKLLSQDLPPSSALLQWESEAREILEVKEQFPGELDIVLLAEGPWPTQLVSSGPEGPEIAPSQHSDQPAHPTFSPAPRWNLPAAQMLSSPGTTELAHELSNQATTLGEGPSPLAIIEQALTAARASETQSEQYEKQASTLQLRLKKSRQQNATLLGELHRTQEQLERTIRVSSKLSRAKTRAEQAAARQQRVRRRQERKVQALRLSREHHMAKVEKLQERIKLLRAAQISDAVNAESQQEVSTNSKTEQTINQQMKRIASLQKETAALKRELKEVSAELRRVTNSRSWKYTRPIRRLNGTE